MTGLTGKGLLDAKLQQFEPEAVVCIMKKFGVAALQHCSSISALGLDGACLPYCLFTPFAFLPNRNVM